MMERPVRKFYDDQLKTLEGMHAKLGFGTAAMLERSFQALKTNDHNGAQTVIESDAEINKLEKEIEYYVMRIIARQQPIGTDLRMILSVFASSSVKEYPLCGAKICVHSFRIGLSFSSLTK